MGGCGQHKAFVVVVVVGACACGRVVEVRAIERERERVNRKSDGEYCKTEHISRAQTKTISTLIPGVVKNTW